MRVQQAKGDEWGKPSWQLGDAQAVNKFAASIGAEVGRKDRIWETPIPAKGA
jgi:hypothetical protein